MPSNDTQTEVVEQPPVHVDHLIGYEFNKKL